MTLPAELGIVFTTVTLESVVAFIHNTPGINRRTKFISGLVAPLHVKHHDKNVMAVMGS